MIVKGCEMMLNKLVLVSLLFSILIGCQSVKFISNGPEENTVNTGTLDLRLLSNLASQTQLSFSFEDEKFVQNTLEVNFTNQPSKRQGLNGELEVIPTKTYKQEEGAFCREYETKLITISNEISVKSDACRQQDGLWLREY